MTVGSFQVWPVDGVKDMSRLSEKLKKAKAAADAQRSDALERSSSGTGQILRANFLLLLEAVLEQDRHLLDLNELGFIETYRVSFFRYITSMLDALMSLMFQLQFMLKHGWKPTLWARCRCSKLVSSAGIHVLCF